MAFNSNLRAVLLKPVNEKPVDKIADGIKRGTNMWIAHIVPDPSKPDVIDQFFLNNQ